MRMVESHVVPGHGIIEFIQCPLRGFSLRTAKSSSPECPFLDDDGSVFTIRIGVPCSGLSDPANQSELVSNEAYPHRGLFNDCLA